MTIKPKKHTDLRDGALAAHGLWDSRVAYGRF